MFGNTEDKKKKKGKGKSGQSGFGGGGITPDDVTILVNGQFGSSIAQLQAASAQNAADLAQLQADAAAEEADDDVEEADTDAEQAAQDAGIAANDLAAQAAATAAAAAQAQANANAANISALDTALNAEVTATDAEQAAQDARLTDLEARVLEQRVFTTVRTSDLNVPSVLNLRTSNVPYMFQANNDIVLTFNPTDVVVVRKDGTNVNPPVGADVPIPKGANVVVYKANSASADYVVYYNEPQDLSGVQDEISDLEETVEDLEDEQVVQNDRLDVLEAPVPATDTFVPRHSYYEGAASTTNLNSATLGTVFAPLMTNVVSEDPSLGTATADSFTVTDAGWYEIAYHIRYTGNGQRTALQSSLFNGALRIGAITNTGYIRAQTGHNVASLTGITQLVKLDAGDVIRVSTQRQSTTTGAATQTAGSAFSIKRI